MTSNCVIYYEVMMTRHTCIDHNKCIYTKINQLDSINTTHSRLTKFV
jgi:hypothetical protein